LSTVLIADDDREALHALAKILTLEGYRVLQASDGQEAFDKALSERPDLLVLDHRMPRMHGADVVAMLRSRGVEIPVVLVTAAMDAARLAREHGIPHLLRKPIDVDALLVLMGKALTGPK
jgi:CheY-like chemotaxis protein